MTAAADAYALGQAHTYADDPHGRGAANARADAVGIQTGSGLS